MITIVGGTYYEHCFEPHWKEIFGSGLRASCAINKLSPKTPISFYTFADNNIEKYLKMRSDLNLTPIVKKIESSINFYYDHPMIEPRIFPRLDTINKVENNIQVEGENILYYGCIEGLAIVRGKKVVYDPQSPINPVLFTDTKSIAEELVYVINLTEARLLSKKQKISDIIDFFFQIENVSALVLKMGPKGALVVTKDREEFTIPVYKTDGVWSIGSGDVFAAVFAFHWFLSNDLIMSAKEASWQTACYCNFRDFQFSPINSDARISAFTIKNPPSKQIYLAGPFFTFSERWLINEIWQSFKNFRVKIFSPWHDVGHGVASVVVAKDLQALDQSAIVFAVLDGLDSGTLFEVGYAIKKGIPVIGYVENESTESIKMLEGTNCILERDLTTAIYKCFWQLAEYE